MNLKYPLLILVTLLIQSCATLISSSHQEIYISSYPAQALVKINGQEVGKTPCAIYVERLPFEKTVVEISKKDIETKKFELKKKFNFTALIPSVGFPAGLALDVSTGACIKYSPKVFYFDLLDSSRKNYDPINFCYFVTLGCDTTYTMPLAKGFEKLKFTKLNTDSTIKIDRDELNAYKYVRKTFWSTDECIYERRKVKMKRDKKRLMGLVLRNGEYSVFYKNQNNVDYSYTKYYLYKGNELLDVSIRGKKMLRDYIELFSKRTINSFPMMESDYYGTLLFFQKK